MFYKVLVRSFQDSNGDGDGDGNGATAKFDYLQWLGIGCLATAVLPTPLRDGGYDVCDYTWVLPEFGDFADFVEFADAAYQRGMRAVIGFVMNRTSDGQPCCQKRRHDPCRPSATTTYGQTMGLPGRTDHLRRYRGIQPDLQPGPQAVLLAPPPSVKSPVQDALAGPIPRVARWRRPVRAIACPT